MTEITTIDEWMAWRDEQRKRHRVMTAGEYTAWRQGGDAISSPTSANPFPGGLTIELNSPPIIGRFRP